MSQHTKYQDNKISSGDTIRVHQEISDGSKTRTQVFEGVVIAIKGRENGKSITVRRIGPGGIGVEKIFPLQLPSIKKIEVKRRGQVKRAKLYYLRNRVGKATKIKEKTTNLQTKKTA